MASQYSSSLPLRYAYPHSAISMLSYASFPRRFVLGVQFPGPMRSTSLSSSSSSFVASARPKSSEAEEILRNVKWPQEYPFKQSDFRRYDESSDTVFYSSPRFVTHIDDQAINALTKYYSSVFPPSNTPGVAILDMCSSWVSHYPKGYKQEKIVGMGLNKEELERNTVLTEYVVQDLNSNPVLPFDDNTFDIITNTVSVDYLTRPLEVFREMRRVLKSGGLACMSFSNFFGQKPLQCGQMLVILTVYGLLEHISIMLEDMKLHRHLIFPRILDFWVFGLVIQCMSSSLGNWELRFSSEFMENLYFNFYHSLSAVLNME